MLILSRKRNERIKIGDNVEVMVVAIIGDKVRLGIRAPRSIPVHRHEVAEAIARDGHHTKSAEKLAAIDEAELERTALEWLASLTADEVLSRWLAAQLAVARLAGHHGQSAEAADMTSDRILRISRALEADNVEEAIAETSADVQAAATAIGNMSAADIPTDSDRQAIADAVLDGEGAA